MSHGVNSRENFSRLPLPPIQRNDNDTGAAQASSSQQTSTQQTSKIESLRAATLGSTKITPSPVHTPSPILGERDVQTIEVKWIPGLMEGYEATILDIADEEDSTEESSSLISQGMKPSQMEPAQSKANHLLEPVNPPKVKRPPSVYETKTPATTDIHPINQTIKTLASRCVANPQGPPQSYNWREYLDNQTKFMTTWSLGEVIGVMCTAYNHGLRDHFLALDPTELCSNRSTLTSCRFLPVDVEATDFQIFNAKKSNNWIDASWKESLVGNIVEEAHTHSGKLSLLLRASNPTSNKQILKQRAQAIQGLMNKQFQAQIKHILQKYAEHECIFLNQFDPKGPGTKKPGRLEVILKIPMFESLVPDRFAEKFRETPPLITANDIYKTFYDMLMTSGKVYAGAFTMWNTASAVAVGSLTQGMAAGTAGGALMITAYAKGEDDGIAKKILLNAIDESAGLNTICMGVTGIGYAWADHWVKSIMQKVMVKVTNNLRAMDEMYEILKDSDYAKNLEHFDKLRNFMGSEEPEIKKLRELIQCRTFDSESAMGVFRGGPMFVLWDLIQGNTSTTKHLYKDAKQKVKEDLQVAEKLLLEANTAEYAVQLKQRSAVKADKESVLKELEEAKQRVTKAKEAMSKAQVVEKNFKDVVPEVKRLIVDAMIAMGEIDGNLTIAEKIMNSTPEAPWSILDVPVENSAHFSIKGAHFPPVSPEALAEQGKISSSNAIKPIPLSTIELPPITIITAENGAGKSTFSLNWINNILSRQSLGVAPCSAGSNFPIYDRVISSLGVTHTNLKSSFEMADEFVKQVLEELKNNPEQKFFLVFDELYRETDAVKGANRLIDFASQLNVLYKNNPNFTAVFITHSEQFAHSQAVSATYYTTEKDGENRPSGTLKPGIYSFTQNSFEPSSQA